MDRLHVATLNILNLADRWQAAGAGPRRIDRDLTQATYEAISATLFGGQAMPEAAAILMYECTRKSFIQTHREGLRWKDSSR